MRRFLRQYRFSVVWGIVVLLLSVLKISLGEEIETMSYADKNLHAFLYAILAVLVCKETKSRGYKIYLFSWLIVSIYGILVELIQIPIPYRSFEWGDVVADSLGAVVGLLFVYFVRLWKERK